MADAKIQIANTTDVLEGTTVTTLAGDNLFREGVVVSDPIVGEARARCLNTTPASNEYGMSVRQVGPVGLDASTLAALESITVQNGAGAAAVNIQDGGNSITVDGPLTNAELRETPVTVTGTVAINTDQLTQLKTAQEIDFINAGILYVGGAKVSVTNNTGVIQLLNPVGSGKTIQIRRFFVACSVDIDINFVKGGTVNASTPRTPSNLNLASNNVSVAKINTGTTGITGGTQFGPTGRLLANVTAPYSLPVLIPPGFQIAATFLATGILTATDCYVSVVWAEV